jgi:ribosomal protein L37AE/L43A
MTKKRYMQLNGPKDYNPPICPQCKSELRQMSTLWSKCPKCGIRMYHGKINDVAAMPNEKS